MPMPPASDTVDLTPSVRLRPGNAVAAIIHTGDGNYLLQRRDRLRTIFYPDHWGCFGGAIDPGETPMQALLRELTEEIGIDFEPAAARTFSRFNFTLDPAGPVALDRQYFDVPVTADTLGRVRLGEGSEFRLVHADEALGGMRLVPYDAFALWLHRHQGSLDWPRTGSTQR